MFRIWFDHRAGQFVVQFLIWGLLWRSVGLAGVTRTWDTYDQADEWVSTVGLRKAFHEQVRQDLSPLLYGKGAR